MKALDLFAGPGGWSLACKWLGIEEHGVELDDAARATREAAGFTTVHDDVTTYVANSAYDILIASPPCQTFSIAGHGAGRLALDVVCDALDEFAPGTAPSRDELTARTGDERTALVLEPVRYVSQWWPSMIALEQVPGVRAAWEAFAEWLEHYHYHVWTGLVHAEQFGVPQTRTRAVLLAANHPVHPPTPTHSRYYSRRPSQMDLGVEPWVSMADALGWSPDDVLRSNYGTGGDPAKRGLRSGAQPAPTVTSKANRNVRYENGARAAFTSLGQQQRYEAEVAEYKPWVHDRPATTIAGRGLVPDPGTNANRFNGATKSRNDGIKVTAEQAGVLQSFPPDFPWRGTKTKQFEQIGNAIPPLLAQALLTSLTKGYA